MQEETDLVVLNIKHPDKALFKRSEEMLEYVRNWEITTPDQLVAAGGDLQALKALAKEVKEKRLAITGPLNKALKEVNALFKPAQDWLRQAESLLKGKILDYQNEQERIAREAQAKVDAEARKDREKLERKARLAKAVRLGDKAEELTQEAEAVMAPVVKSAAPKVAGVVRRETWKAEVTDKRALIQHIARPDVDLLELVQINQSFLNGMARRRKDDLNLPGVRAVKEANIAARGGS